MKLNEGIEWAIHCCSMLASLPDNAALPARRLAEFFNLPEHYLAKHLQSLSQAGLVVSTKGPGGGYRLARLAAEISLLDIVEAIDGRAAHFQCTEIRRRGPSGVDASCYNKPCGIARAMHKAEQAWRKELAAVSLSEIQHLGLVETPPEQLKKSLEWFGSVLK
jgi:Rrf2 family protein